MTDYLFARPSFLAGLGRTIDVGGTFDTYNESETEAEADRLAVALDWRAVGYDLRGAIEEADSELQAE